MSVMSRVQRARANQLSLLTSVDTRSRMVPEMIPVRLATSGYFPRRLHRIRGLLDRHSQHPYPASGAPLTGRCKYPETSDRPVCSAVPIHGDRRPPGTHPIPGTNLRRQALLQRISGYFETWVLYVYTVNWTACVSAQAGSRNHHCISRKKRKAWTRFPSRGLAPIT